MGDLPQPPQSSSSEASGTSSAFSVPTTASALDPAVLTVGGLMSLGWKFSKKHAGDLFLAGLVFYGMVALAGGLAASLPWKILGNILQTMIMLIIPVGLDRYYLRLVDTGKHELREFFCPDVWPRVLLVSLVLSVVVSFAVLFGLLLLLVPGIYLTLRWFFYSQVLADHPEKGFREILSVAWRGTQGQIPLVIAVSIAQLVIILLGLLCLGVGVFPAIFVCKAITILVYRHLHPRSLPVQAPV